MEDFMQGYFYWTTP